MSELGSVIRRWAAMVPLEHLEDELRRLECERAALETRIRLLKGQATLLADVRDLVEGTTRSVTPTKRDAVLRVLAESEDDSMRLVDIRAQLLRRGWIDDDARATHALEVAVSDMARRGELRRVRRGVYSLEFPPNEEVAA